MKADLQCRQFELDRGPPAAAGGGREYGAVVGEHRSRKAMCCNGLVEACDDVARLGGEASIGADEQARVVDDVEDVPVFRRASRS